MPTNQSQRPSKTAILRKGRRFSGAGKRATAPTPFLHSHPANADARENRGREVPAQKPA